jgi:hypothetical protein
VELTQPGGERGPQRRVEPIAGARILLGDPGDRGRIAGGFEAPKRIGDDDAVQRLDQVEARSSQRLPAA